MSAQSVMPTIYLPHGGGPCFFMDWTISPADTWNAMGEWLRGVGSDLPQKPQALLVISAHWEANEATVTTHANPPLIYDYSGFPPHTYELTWPAPGAPDLAQRVVALLTKAGVSAQSDASRGFDHGVFIPLKLAYPDAEVPTVQLSLKRGLDPEHHLAIGRALEPLRHEGVLIVGSGMSFHNLGALMGRSGVDATAASREFDGWLTTAVELDSNARNARLAAWKAAPGARQCHPREEHLLPLMVAAGAADEARGSVVFRDSVLGCAISAVRFG